MEAAQTTTRDLGMETSGTQCEAHVSVLGVTTTNTKNNVNIDENDDDDRD